MRHEVKLPAFGPGYQLSQESVQGLVGQALVVEVDGRQAKRGEIVAAEVRDAEVVITVEDGESGEPGNSEHGNGRGPAESGGDRSGDQGVL